MNLSQRLRKRREQLKLTNGQVSTYLAISKSHLSDMESGKNNPSLELLARLAHYYKTNTDYLLGLTDDKRQLGQLIDRVMLTVEDSEERKMLQEALEMLAEASTEDKEYIFSLIRRLAPKKPRIIGGE